MDEFTRAISYWRQPFETALKQRSPYRFPAGFHDAAPRVPFDDARLLAGDVYRAFLAVYLDMQAKHDLEVQPHAATDFCFTMRKMELALAFPDAQIRDYALCLIMREHLRTFGTYGCEPLAALFRARCTDAAQRAELLGQIDGARRANAGHQVFAYRDTARGVLNAHVFMPAATSGALRPAICFLFGGGWYDGTPEQFFPFCRFFAARGFVAASFEYRIKGRSNDTPLDGLHDARAAIRWLRAHAEEWGIDPARVTAAGWSAGGHLAACLACIDGIEEPSADTRLSARPGATVLIAPCVDPLRDNWFHYVLRGACDDVQLSPHHHIRQGMPPCLLFLGTADEFIPVDSVRAFAQAMKEHGNTCDLVLEQGLKHADFMNDAACERIHAFLSREKVA
ncbi:alpha/beta hydrolase [bacterium]|nr:alpha/beta hydrolase [bacterium]